MLKLPLLTIIFLPLNAKAGWLLWEAPSYISSPADEKEVRSVEEALPLIPPNARLADRPGIELKLDAVFEAGAGELRDFLGAAGFEETSREFKKSFFAALPQLFNARFPTLFPPAPKWLTTPFPTDPQSGWRPQDLSFIRLQAGAREGIYLWRLPCRTKKAPLWAAGIKSPNGKTYWAAISEKTKKSRALELKARLTGKTYQVFTIP